MIPKIFHQVWLGSNRLPEEYARYRETWAHLHPGWEFRMWTEDNLPDSLVHAEVRNRLRVPAERADILRLEVLYQQGGVYLDTDMECLRPIDELLADVEVFAGDSKPGHANNAVMGAVPEHAFIAHALSECRPREFHGYDKAAAGPWLIDRLVRENPHVKVFEPWVFYPSTSEERSRAYAIHHAARSWKEAEGFRGAALVAEKRLQEVQDDIWRLVQEIEAAASLTDREELRARVAQIAADYRPRELRSAGVAKARIEGLEPGKDGPNTGGAASGDLLRTVEKRVAQRMRRQLQRVEHRLFRLDQRVAHLEKRKARAAAAPEGAASDVLKKDASSDAAVAAPAPAGEDKPPPSAHVAPPRVKAAAAVAPKTASPARKNPSKADGKAKRQTPKWPRPFVRIYKALRDAWKRGRRAKKLTQRAVGRVMNMRYRSTYATRLDLVKDRDELPVVLNKRGLLGCGVEIGVKTGAYSDVLLKVWRGKRLISIDPWLEDAPQNYVDRANVPQSQQNEFYEMTKRRLAVYGERSVIWRKTSAEGAKEIEDHTLDFVYIDARHDYDSVLEDLHLWYDKVRPGGFIAGHDYADGVFDQGVFGVKSAVDEFFGALNLKVYSTEGKYPVEVFASWVVEKSATPPRRDAASQLWVPESVDSGHVSAIR